MKRKVPALTKSSHAKHSPPLCKTREKGGEKAFIIDHETQRHTQNHTKREREKERQMKRKRIKREKPVVPELDAQIHPVEQELE